MPSLEVTLYRQF